MGQTCDAEVSVAVVSALFDENPTPMVVTRPSDSALLDANRAGRELFGIDRDTLDGLHGSDFWANRQDRTEVVREIAERGALRGKELALKSNDGRPLWTMAHARFVDWKGERGLLWSLTDITLRKQMEAELAASKERYEALFRTMAQGVVYQDATGQITSVNPAAERILGFSLEQIRGRTSEDPAWSPVREDGTPFPGNAHPAMVALRTGEPVENVVVGVCHGVTGERRWLLISAIPQRGADGRVNQAYAVFSDITERKRAEHERLQLDERLRQTQKLESLGVLAGGVAHDFNNLLMGILGSADLALCDAGDQPEITPHLEGIIRASTHAAELCNQLLAYAGKGRFLIEPLDLSRLARSIAPMLETSVSKKAQLVLRLADDVPRIQADASQLQQLLLNLVVNASEALGDKGGVITVTTSTLTCGEAELAHSYTDEKLAPGHYVELAVSDNGCGMNADMIKKIFDPFYSTKFTGRGLGLPAALGIVRSHRGAIKVYSEPSRGSLFRILFPVDEVSTQPRPLTASERDWRGQGTVLLADDDENARAVGQEMLARFGFDVLLASDGYQAVERFQAHAAQIVCVLLDLTMPGMDGAEVFTALRHIRKDARILLTSGYSEQDVLPRFAGKGLAGFIQKPFRLVALRQCLREVLEGAAPTERS